MRIVTKSFKPHDYDKRMFLWHYLLAILIFTIFRDKFMLLAILLGNLIDLDHIYYRLIGKVSWFGSACNKLGEDCSIGFYPLHSPTFIIIFLLLSLLILAKNKKIKFLGWISLGAFSNLLLDYIQQLSGLRVTLTGSLIAIEVFLLIISLILFFKIVLRFKLKKIPHPHLLFVGLLLIITGLFLKGVYLFEIGTAFIVSDLVHYFYASGKI